MSCRDGSTEGGRRGMEVGLGGNSTGGDKALSDERVRMDAEVKNYRVHRREASLKYVYRGGEDVGIQHVPKVVGPRTRTYTGREEGRSKEK